MPLAALVSLALLATDPSGMRMAQADPTPPAASEALSTGRSPDDEARAAAAATGEPIPNGAPVEDYAFVGWCAGALTEHTALRPRVWSQVERIERQFPSPSESAEQALAGYDEDQQTQNEELALFGRALDAAEARGGKTAADRAAAIEAGRQIWKGSDTADTRQLAQLWMSWAPPPRCDTVANKLVGAPR